MAPGAVVSLPCGVIVCTINTVVWFNFAGILISWSEQQKFKSQILITYDSFGDTKINPDYGSDLHPYNYSNHSPLPCVCPTHNEATCMLGFMQLFSSVSTVAISALCCYFIAGLEYGQCLQY